ISNLNSEQVAAVVQQLVRKPVHTQPPGSGQPPKLAGRDKAARIGHSPCCDLFNTGIMVPWRHTEKPWIHDLPTIPLPHQPIRGVRSFVPQVCAPPSNALPCSAPSATIRTALPSNCCTLYVTTFLRSLFNQSTSSSAHWCPAGWCGNWICPNHRHAMKWKATITTIMRCAATADESKTSRVRLAKRPVSTQKATRR